jgi:Mrp family chromosome partitioning ATPase
MPTHEIARYAYPIIEVVGSEPAPVREKRSRTSTLKLSLCPPTEPKTDAITRWRRPATVVEQTDLPEQLDENLVMLKAPESAAATSYRLLRHRLLAAGDPRVIGVTSAAAGEGKSCCAINLALAIGEQIGTRVLVIEANVRKPWMAKAFGFSPSQCFAERMANLDGVTEPWIMTKLEGTRVELSAIDPRASEHPKLDRVLFANTIRDLRAEYDYIVVDTPSVLDSADVNSVADAADGVIMVARTRITRRKLLRSAIEQLAPARVLGVVLVDGAVKGDRQGPPVQRRRR